MFNWHFFRMVALWFIILAIGIWGILAIDDGEFAKNFFAKEVDHLESFFGGGIGSENTPDTKGEEGNIEVQDDGGFKVRY